MSHWPEIDYFHANTATAKAKLAELEPLAREGWYSLYRHKTDGSLWRIDAEDKYQQGFIVQVTDPENWASFDSSAMEKRLLLSARGGHTQDRCVVAGCHQKGLVGSAFCLDHTYERGVRK